MKVDPGSPVVIILASESEVREFKPGRGQRTFSERKNPEYDFLRKGSKAEIRDSEQNLSDFSRSMPEAKLMT